MPVEDAPDEGRDQEGAGIGARCGLHQREQQGQVAVDAFLLQHFGSADAFPGRGDLDQDALAPDAALLIGFDEGARLVERRRGVEGEIGIDLGGDPAGDDGGQLGTEVQRQPVAYRLGDVLQAAALLLAPHDGLVDQRGISGLLGGFQQQRRVGGAVLRLQAPHRLDVTGVGDDHGHGAELVEL